MSRLLVLYTFLLACLPAFAATSASDTAKQIAQAGLDPSECYRVLELNFSKEDLRVYLTSGYIIFAKPVNGFRAGAIFSAEVEAGDAELLLLPPVRSERMSLAAFTESPNLNEHFQTAVMLFTDNTGEELMAKIQAAGSKKVPEMAAILADKWDPVIKNLSSSFQVNLVEDVLNQDRKSGFLYMAVSGGKVGNFDVFFDAKAEENILVGQLAERKGQTLFDVWTSFPSRSRREGTARSPLPDVALENFRIDATLDPDLSMKAITRVTVTPKEKIGRALPFVISRQMRVSEVKVDGQPVEVFQRESLRSSIIASTGNEQFLVVTPAELEPGKPHEFEFRHEGSVISKAGDQVFYVGARGAWYPKRNLEFARYDLTFRYPKDLGFVASGDVVEDRTEGDVRITRRTTSSPIRFVGFNLGNYKSVSIVHEPYRVEVYANRQLESALKPKAVSPPDATAVTPAFSHRRVIDPMQNAPMPPPAADPVGRLKTLANDVASAFDFMAGLFGPPPMKTLTVSPIPGGFGQGFPGLLYLSTLAYLDPSQRPATNQTRVQTMFFSDMLDAHEVAHQWWGNLVVTSGYQDAWLMEALANYSALLYLEKKKGPKALETLLDDYRTNLLAKGPNDQSLESAGPITWGYRLQSSLSPDSWHYITYEKGAWVLHMLRRRMGDDRFLAMLKAMCARYEYRPISTEEFRQLAKEFVDPRSPDSDLKSFFENWVYGTGIPAVKMTYAIRGMTVSGTVVQSGVGDDFTARIPIEIQAGRQRTLTWVATSNEPTPFSITLKAPPTKVGLAVKDALMTVKK